MNDDKEKSVFERLKDTVSEAVENMATGMAGPYEQKNGERVAATTTESNEPMTKDEIATAVEKKKRKAATKKRSSKSPKTTAKKAKSSARKAAAKKRPAKKVAKKRKSKR
jgi:hypothetical protein